MKRFLLLFLLPASLAAQAPPAPTGLHTGPTDLSDILIPVPVVLTNGALEAWYTWPHTNSYWFPEYSTNGTIWIGNASELAILPPRNVRAQGQMVLLPRMIAVQDDSNTVRLRKIQPVTDLTFLWDPVSAVPPVTSYRFYMMDGAIRQFVGQTSTNSFFYPNWNVTITKTVAVTSISANGESLPIMGEVAAAPDPPRNIAVAIIFQ